MGTWVPCSREQVETIIAEQEADLSPERRALFEGIRVPLRPAGILRSGEMESIFVVAQLGNRVIYYEDIEDGFNISELAPDGTIANPGFEQWELGHALHWFAA